jgi:heterotetrameric sarcosine oxidase gamma subunit
MDDAKIHESVTADVRCAVTRIDAGPMAVLRLFQPAEADIAAASERLGFPLSVEPLRLRDCSAPNARLGPGEWIILGEDPSSLSMRLADIVHHASGVGHARTRWRLKCRAWELLQRGCSLDLDPVVFAPGSCVRTLLAQISVLILRPSSAPDLEVICDSSLADYLQQWLSDAAAGFA